MAKNKRKYKRHPKKPAAPPLTVVDTLICWALLLFAFAFPIGGFKGLEALRRQIGFTDGIAAVRANGSSFLVLPLLFFVSLTCLILSVVLLSFKQPIFGEKNVSYGTKKYKDVYPLFGKQKKKRNETENRLWRRGIKIWLSVFLVFLFLFPFGIFGRKTLSEEGKVSVFSAVNGETASYTYENIKSMEFSVYDFRVAKYHRENSVKMTLTFSDDRKAAFTLDDFKSDSDLFAINGMLALKAKVTPGRISYQKKDLDLVIRDRKPGAEERRLLFALFDTD